MALMTGTYTKQIDRKGRVSVPAPLRNLLLVDGAATFKIRPVPRQPTLEAMSLKELEEIHDVILHDMPMGSVEQGRALDQFVSEARDATPDAEGRIVLPQDFREILEGADEITFVGRGATVQIWAADTHRARQEERRRTEAPVVLPPRRRG